MTRRTLQPADAATGRPGFRSLGGTLLLLLRLLLLCVPVSASADAYSSPNAPNAASAQMIIERAHEAAGGALWTRPRSLYVCSDQVHPWT